MTVRVVNVRGLTTPGQRAGVVYVGRAFAGWPAHPLANPFKLAVDTPKERAACLAKYADWLSKRTTYPDELAALWAACRRGELPLGCWCCDWDGDSRPVPLCHACMLAEALNVLHPAGVKREGES